MIWSHASEQGALERSSRLERTTRNDCGIACRTCAAAFAPVEDSRAASRNVKLREVLHEFLSANTAAIVARTRAKVAARFAPRATDEELNGGIPLFLDQLIDLLRHSDASIRAMVESAAEHGRTLLEQGFTVAQVVHDYGDVCQTVTELAAEMDAPITTDEFRTLNRCLDDAIAEAVTEYTAQRERSIEIRCRRGYFLCRPAPTPAPPKTSSLYGKNPDQAEIQHLNLGVAGIRHDLGCFMK